MREKIEEVEREIKYLRKHHHNNKSSIAISNNNQGIDSIDQRIKGKFKDKNSPQSDGSSSTSDHNLTTIGTLTVDSGRWSDNSSSGFNRNKSTIKTVSDESDGPISFEQQQDVEEDIMIYVPMKTINALDSSARGKRVERKLSSPSSDEIIKTNPDKLTFIRNPIYNKRPSTDKKSTLDPLDSRWRQRQRRLSCSSNISDVNSVQSNPNVSKSSSAKKSFAVLPAPRKSKSVNALLDPKDDRDHGKPKCNGKGDSGNRALEISATLNGSMSKSTSKISVRGNINNLVDSREALSSDELDYFSWVHPLEQEIKLDHPLYIDDADYDGAVKGDNYSSLQNLEKSQFVLKPKNTEGLDKLPLSKSPFGESPPEKSDRGKELKKKSSSVRSCLQSYFFAGTVSKSYDCKSYNGKSSSKKGDIVPSCIGNDNDNEDNPVKIISTKKAINGGTLNSIFSSKHKFINKGHANCGLFTSITDGNNDEVKKINQGY